jgi:hypothetical protein
MTRSVILVIPEKAVTWNLFWAGVPHKQRTAVKNLWRALMLQSFDVDMDIFTKPVHVYVWAESKDDPLDVDNVCVKIMLDPLKGRLIKDDNPRYVRVISVYSYKSGRDCVTIELEEVE